MGVVDAIGQVVISEGHDWDVSFDPEGRHYCLIDGIAYRPFDAAERFVPGGWAAVYKD